MGGGVPSKWMNLEAICHINSRNGDTRETRVCRPTQVKRLESPLASLHITAASVPLLALGAGGLSPKGSPASARAQKKRFQEPTDPSPLLGTLFSE